MELAMRAMGSLLPKLGELLKEEYGLQKGVKKKIETLSRELDAAHAVLREISSLPPDQLNELVKLWARDVREASYDMEDIIDTFLVHVDSPVPANPHILRRFRRKVITLFKKSKARRNISCQIQEIYKKLEELAARRDRYRSVDSIVTKPATTIDPRILNLYKSATELVGIEGPKDELIDMLCLEDDDDDASCHKKMKIVSLVGFGGLGKTTLAKAVYDQLKTHFKWGAFIPVGQNPDIKKVLRDILIGLDKEKFMNSNMIMLDEKQLMDELREFTKEKRCFIVIDDIWDTESLKLIKCAMQETNYGSRLVITTRIFEVATYVGEAYKMQPLSHDNSKKLLYARIVDGEGKDFDDSPSAKACEKVLKKCGGVPLAIITIASLLANKPPKNWSEVYNSIGFGHQGNNDVDNTRKILSFSYYELPSHLKACLLYLSIFPEDHIIEKNSLIWMWRAEGFISEEQAAIAGVGLFELGNMYFNELINRNMILPQETQYEGYIDACSVHDMVLDLIHQLSSEEKIVTILNDGEQQKLQGSISRRLALHCVVEHNVVQLANIAMEKVRSIVSSDSDFFALCPHLPFLRVAEIGRYDYYNEYNKDCSKDYAYQFLGSLLHLRYLSISITKLPREVRHLRFLQTLDIQNYSIKELPEEVGLLTQLVCLRLRVYQGIRVPTGLISKITSLQELCICSEGQDATIQFLEELCLLRQLRVLKTRISVECRVNIMSSFLESLGHLHNIQELEISESPTWTVSVSNAELDSCRHLRFLRLVNMVFSRLPAWIKSSLTPHLSYLDLNVKVVKDQDMETLAKLPELSCLILHSKSYMVHLSENSVLVSIKLPTESAGYFCKLRFLKVHGSSIWFDLCGSESNSSRVPSSNTIMPSLESLEFDVHVRSLKDENLHLGFEKLLGFQNLGTSSLKRVTAKLYCGSAHNWEVEEAEAALKHTTTVHPKHPSLQTNRVEVHHPPLISRYQEACMEMSRVPESVIKAWKMADIDGSGHIQILRMPDPEASSNKVMHLLYTDNGVALLALVSNAVHKLWKWEHSGNNPHGKSSKSVPPVLWQPENGIHMKNDTTDGNDPEEATACTAISKNDRYLISASGGKVSLFNMKTFKVMNTFMAPPPAATFLAFYPLDNNIIAFGREDSSIQIYNVRTDKVQTVLIGHQKKITGLAFSQSMEVLVSSGADAQLCVWSTDSWEKKKSIYIKNPSNGSSGLDGDTMVQFHYDETHLLVVHESQLAIYDMQLECLCSWFPRDALPASISSAVYSLGCLLVYAGFHDGTIGIFKAESLTLQCRIAPSAYIPSSISSDGEAVFPTAIATHPWKPNQIAVGMSDGAVYVLEPLDTDDDGQVESDSSLDQRPRSNVSSSSGDSQPSV